jgi:diguanylate cyclase (GGDEF)-like protein
VISLKSYLSNIKAVLSRDNDYTQKQFEDNKNLTILLFIINAFLGPSLWLWDFTTDPIGAENTVLLRLSFFFVFVLPGLAFIVFNHVRLLFIISLLTIMMTEFIFIIILNNLDGGMTYGIGGFMYFLFFGALLFQGFPLIHNFIYSFVITAFPYLLGIVGIAENFQYDHYGALLWPATMTAIFVQIGTSLNYSYRYELEQKLLTSSITDSLTQVYNRNKIKEVLNTLYARYKRDGAIFGLLIFDIDLFKKVNDKYGHSIGDDVLVDFCNTLKGQLREIDILGRLGGEEFILVVEKIEQENIYFLAEKIRKNIEAHKFAKGITVTTSIGASIINSQDSIESLIARADEALYKSKESGRNKSTLL